MRRNGWCLACLAAVILAGCGTEGTIRNEIELLAPVEAVVDTEAVVHRDLYKLTTKNAELAPYTEELAFPVRGKVSNLYAEIGSTVKAGDVLAEQEEDGVRDTASNALNNYLSEKKVYVDVLKSVKKALAGQPDKEEREQQELLKEQAEELWAMQEPILWSAWVEARARLGKSQIVAPYDGVVTACISKGKTVAAGQPVLALADMSRLYVAVASYLAPSEYGKYERVYALVNGKEVELTYIEELMEEEGAYTYYVPAELNGAVMGDFVLVCMVSEYHPQVLSVPNSAVYRDGNGNYVYLQENGEKVRRDVVIGYVGESYSEVAEGLQEGDRVYVKN